MTNEIRQTLGELEFRGADNGQSIVASGYAAVFGMRSENLGGFIEVIDSKAFNKTVKEADVRALFNHDPAALLGRTSSGTLTLGVDERGLPFSVRLPDTSVGRDAAKLLERGDITGTSFGFSTVRDSWGQTEDGFPLRSLQEVRLHEVSLVTFPAYPDTEVALRSLATTAHVDLNQVREAAEANELASILNQEKQEERTSVEEESRKASTLTLRMRSIR